MRSIDPSPGQGLTSYSDFCVFAPPKPNSTISDTEGEEVSWCTRKESYGRLIPSGTITGIQVLHNVNYMQIVAFVHQENINIQTGDYGGELDSGGQDEVRRIYSLHRLSRVV